MRCSAMRIPSTRCERLAAGEPGHCLRRVGDRNDHGGGNAQPRRPAAHDTRDVGEHVGEQDVGAAEDVAFADRAAFERRDVAVGNVVDVDEIETGIDEIRASARAPPRR